MVSSCLMRACPQGEVFKSVSAQGPWALGLECTMLSAVGTDLPSLGRGQPRILAIGCNGPLDELTNNLKEGFNAWFLLECLQLLEILAFFISTVHVYLHRLSCVMVVLSW